MKTKLILSGTDYESKIKKITKKEFEKLVKFGVPDDENYEFWDELNLYCESSLIYNFENDLIIDTGHETIPIGNSINTDYKTVFYPVKRWINRKGSFYLIQLETGGQANYSIQINENFNPALLSFSILRGELPNGHMINELNAMYNNIDFEFEEGFGYQQSEIFLVDDMGEIFNL
jgi:hypothetical protein